MGQLTLLLLLCVGLDVSNPLLPGSQRFNPDECIEVVHAERPRVGGPTDRLAFRPGTDRLPLREIRPSMRAPGPETLRRPPLLRRCLPRDPADLAPPSEDH
jgi:hypothetical protein